MFCGNCGNKQLEGAKFCASCGSAMGDSAGQPVTSTATGVQALASKFSKKTLVAAGAAVAIFAIAGTLLLTQKSGPDFEKALKSCGLTTTSPGITYSAEENTLVMNGNSSDESSYVDMLDEDCVVKALKVSAVVQSRIGTTNGLMGLQTGEWANIHAEWTYSGNNGWDITLSPKK